MSPDTLFSMAQRYEILELQVYCNKLRPYLAIQDLSLEVQSFHF